MNSVTIKSCNDGTELTFDIVGSSGEIITFSAAISGAPFVGSIETSTYFSGPPSLLFSEMAKNWRGWKGEKIWAAIDGELTLKATSSSTGSICIKIQMFQMSGDFQLISTVGIEAGQLEVIAKKVNALFQK